jgi:hypothetical protein
VPPHLRKGAAAGGERMAGKYEKDDLATLRVTNVSFAFHPSALCPSIVFGINTDFTFYR